MKKLLTFLLLLISIVVTSCRHDKGSLDTSINYPSAYIVNAGDNSISVINTTTNKVVDKIELPNSNFPYHIYISPDKKLLAVSVTNHDLSNGFPTSNFNSYNSGNKVVVIDAVTKSIIREISLTQLASNAIFSPNSNELWIGQADDVQSKMLVYKVADWSLITTVPLGIGLAEITFCSDGDMSFTCTSGDDSVQMYDTFYKGFLMNSKLPAHPTGAWPSDHHSNFITCDGNNTVYELNADDCQTIDTLALGYKPGHIKYNSSKSEMWLTDVTNGKVHWFKEINSHWTEQGTILVGSNPRWIAFSDDEKIAFVANQNNNSVSIINVSNHAVTSTIAVGISPSSIAVKL